MITFIPDAPTYRVYFRTPTGRISSLLHDAPGLPASVGRGAVLLAVAVVPTIRAFP